MLNNRSMPESGVIPVLSYPNVTEAARWLCDAFGFRERLGIGDHRIQLHASQGAVVVAAGKSEPASVSIMIRIEDVDAHCRQARAHGATILGEPTNFPYGERQYSVRDPAG